MGSPACLLSVFANIRGICIRQNAVRMSHVGRVGRLTLERHVHIVQECRQYRRGPPSRWQGSLFVSAKVENFLFHDTIIDEPNRRQMSRTLLFQLRVEIAIDAWL